LAVKALAGGQLARESLFEFDPTPMTELQEYLGRVAGQWDQVLSRLKALVES
jgi:hypothetical protein